jgi:hypothetical protein
VIHDQIPQEDDEVFPFSLYFNEAGYGFHEEGLFSQPYFHACKSDQRSMFFISAILACMQRKLKIHGQKLMGSRY